MNFKSRLDHLIQRLAKIRNDVANNPEVELDINGELHVIETAVDLLDEVVEEELK
jgi:hypothetical protein